VAAAKLDVRVTDDDAAGANELDGQIDTSAKPEVLAGADMRHPWVVALLLIEEWVVVHDDDRCARWYPVQWKCPYAEGDEYDGRIRRGRCHQVVSSSSR
jgi:hypothetical protein